jgi:hypothetical protein
MPLRADDGPRPMHETLMFQVLEATRFFSADDASGRSPRDPGFHLDQYNDDPTVSVAIAGAAGGLVGQKAT